VQTEEPKQFRLNKQVLIMLAAVLFALALPLAVVAFFVAENVKAREQRAAEARADAASGALQTALEGIAAANLAPGPIGDAALEIQTSNVRAERRRVIDLAAAAGGEGVVISEGDGGKIWVRIPESRIPAFRAACLDAANGKALPTGPSDEPRALLEIVIRSENP